MLKSFRLRVALLSALLSGIALAGFSAFAWWVVYDIKVKQINTDITAHVEREARRRLAPDGWQHFETQVLPRTLSIRNPQHLLLLVETKTGETVYRSAHWPDGMESTKFPWTAIPEDQFRPPPFDHPPPFDRPPPFGHPPPFDGAPSEHPPPEPLGAPHQAITLHRVQQNDVQWQFGLSSTPHGRIAIAINLDCINDDMSALRNGFLFAMPIALIFIGLSAWFLSGRALKPVQRLGQSMQRVTAQGLDHRIVFSGEAREFAALILGFNTMLERLEKSFHQASRFSADAAHELNTPLTILQGLVEQAINQAEAGSVTQTSLSIILDEIQRLSSILRKLLLLSKADAGKLRLKLTPLDLSSVLLELVEDTQMLAPQLHIEGDIAPNLSVDADEELFRQVLVNLANNAIKYNLKDGWIRIVATATPQHTSLVIANSSMGIPAESLPRLFERFYRVDAAHSRHIEGVGLGLSLCHEIVLAHGGVLTLSVNALHVVQLTLRIPRPK